MNKKKIAETKRDKQGVVVAVKFKGNKTFTKKETAIKMAKNNKIEDVHVVTTSMGDEYLRSNPNSNKQDNLDNL